jgi:hypothetical protein
MRQMLGVNHTLQVLLGLGVGDVGGGGGGGGGLDVVCVVLGGGE